MVVGGLLLAAGSGRRMGLPKGLLRGADGRPWVARAAGVLRAGGCDPVLVVVGAEAERVAALVPPPALAVTATDWAQGLGASLRTGLAALEGRIAVHGGDPPGRRRAVVAVLVGLVDTPGVTPQVVERLVVRATADGPEALLRAAYDGVPGHPVVLGREHWRGAAAAARGDTGARAYLAARAVDLVECGDAGDGRDVDDPAALRGADPPGSS